jgi:hypothetical protein
MEAVLVTTPASKGSGPSTRNLYRTTARVQMNDRRLLLRGGVYDGKIWVGVVGVGERAFCGGDDPWSLAGMYVVTGLVTEDEDGPLSIAVPLVAQ